VEKSGERVTWDGKAVKKVLRKGVEPGDEAVRMQSVATGGIPFAAMLRCRIRVLHGSVWKTKLKNPC
jgi:hypothetical protein